MFSGRLIHVFRYFGCGYQYLLVLRVGISVFSSRIVQVFRGGVRVLG